MKTPLKFAFHLTLVLLSVTFVALGQADSTVDSSQDSTNDAYDWAAMIIAAISIFVNGWQAWLNSKLTKARDVLDQAITGVDQGLDATALRRIIEKGREFKKKESA